MAAVYVSLTVGCGRTPLEPGGFEAGAGAWARGGVGGGAPVQGGVSASAGGAAGTGTPQREIQTCSAPENDSRWAQGARLYVGNGACSEGARCYANLQSAIAAAASGDTIILLPGVYAGAQIYQSRELSSLRITAQDRGATTIVGTLRVTGTGEADGSIWIDNLTFRDSGPRTSSVEDGWGVYVSSWTAVDVRIQDNVFVEHSGRGGLALWSSTVHTRFHAVVARNQFFDNSGEEAALSIDLPADPGEDYCIRVENNLIAANRVGLAIFYTPFMSTPGQFELLNNTVANNQSGVGLSGPAGHYKFVNNVIFGNDRDLPEGAELGGPFDFRHNLIGSGQFSGLAGNFAADPLFIDPRARDFRLQSGSPAAGRGELASAPLSDIDGAARDTVPDLGAYERVESAGESLAGLVCGDGIIQRGSTTTAAGTYLGFETCDDGNTSEGDGCSALCQLEPSGALGLISMTNSNLCVIRKDGSLSCWNDAATGAPTGTFRQVAVSAYHACALRSDGTIACWRDYANDALFTPPGVFEQISGDYEQTCGVHQDGSIECWDEDGVTLQQAGPFVRVDTNRRVCALSADGEMSCWEPYESFPPGPFLQLFPGRYGGCGLKTSGELVCVAEGGIVSLERGLPAVLVRAHVRDSRATGVRPDGRIVRWDNHGAVSLPAQDREVVEVVTGFLGGCALTRNRTVYCWGDNHGLPQE